MWGCLVVGVWGEGPRGCSIEGRGGGGCGEEVFVQGPGGRTRGRGQGQGAGDGRQGTGSADKQGLSGMHGGVGGWQAQLLLQACPAPTRQQAVVPNALIVAGCVRLRCGPAPSARAACCPCECCGGANELGHITNDSCWLSSTTRHRHTHTHTTANSRLLIRRLVLVVIQVRSDCSSAPPQRTCALLCVAGMPTAFQRDPLTMLEHLEECQG